MIKRLQDLFKQYKEDKAKEKAKVEKQARLEALIAHIPEDDKNKRSLYITCINNVIETLEMEQRNHQPKACPKCKHQEPAPTSGITAILPTIVVEVLDNLEPLFELIGVQPMTGPVGLVYSMQHVDKTQEGEQTRTRLEIISQAVEAGSRKLQAGWTIEAMQDMNAQHSMDFVKEMALAIGQEVASEIQAELLNDLFTLGKTQKYKTKGFLEDSDLSDMSSTSMKNLYKKLELNIFKAAEQIGKDTKRSPGNFVVVSPMIVSFMQAFGTFAPHISDEEERKPFTELQQVGTLNGTMKVYSYIDFSGNDNKILVGYKGGNGHTDTGLIYSPYVMLMSSGITVNPKTFQPGVNLMTRYGKSAQENAKDYYKVIKLIK